MVTGPPTPVKTGYSSSGVSTPTPRHASTSRSYRAKPRSCTGSSGWVHSSWLPGAQMTVAYRSRSDASVASTMATCSATSPATISQSSGESGRSWSTMARFSEWRTCRSLMAHSVAPFTNVMVPAFLGALSASRHRGRQDRGPDPQPGHVAAERLDQQYQPTGDGQPGQGRREDTGRRDDEDDALHRGHHLAPVPSRQRLAHPGQHPAGQHERVPHGPDRDDPAAH